MAQHQSGVPRPALIVAIVLGALLVVAVGAVGVVSNDIAAQQEHTVLAAQQARRTGPLVLPAVAAPKAGTSECSAVLAALPRQLLIDGAQVPRRVLAQPPPPGAAAWGDAAHDPVIVRCGIEPPAELTPTSGLLDVSGVSWLRIVDGGDTSWIAVDRPVYVSLTLPTDSGSGPIQDMSNVLSSTLPGQSVFPLRD